jgi:hypothetical protein
MLSLLRTYLQAVKDITPEAVVMAVAAMSLTPTHLYQNVVEQIAQGGRGISHAAF